MPLMQVRFSGAARDFSPRVNFQCRLCYGVRTPLCAIACVNTCVHVKDSPCQSSVYYSNAKTSSMHRRFWAATCCNRLSMGKLHRFPMGEIPLGQHSCKKSKLKQKQKSCQGSTALLQIWPPQSVALLVCSSQQWRAEEAWLMTLEGVGM